MRGRHRERVQPVGGCGTTPAYAGKTVPTMSPTCSARDHPRVCGEDRVEVLRPSPRTGPPPRMRGRLFRRPIHTTAWGTTPAYAGKTSSSCCTSACGTDHPRVCGEDPCVPVFLRRGVGPPPRMRGRLGPLRCLLLVVGNTPAYAGKTTLFEPFGTVVWDHPRVCGEDSLVAISTWMAGGPPPRMRGRPISNVRHETQHWTTPAYAGKTLSAVWVTSTSADHPRVCGEDVVLPVPLQFPAGPPPRMRGRRPHGSPKQRGRRTTPAYAGKTSITRRIVCPSTDHPRVCGEDPA